MDLLTQAIVQSQSKNQYYSYVWTQSMFNHSNTDKHLSICEHEWILNSRLLLRKLRFEKYNTYSDLLWSCSLHEATALVTISENIKI